MSEQSRETIEKGNEPTSIRSADPPPIRQTGAAPEKQKPTGRRKILLGAAGVLILAGALWFGIPWVQTTSTRFRRMTRTSTVTSRSGFPECWYSWRHQLRALAEAGFRVAAPDFRGYGRSDRPEEVEKYTVLHDIGDIVGLVDALGAQQAVIAGHDIGATVAWQAALLRPDRFRGVIALGPPFRPRVSGSGSAPPTTLMPRNEDAVFYQLYFQTPEAEAALGRDIRRLFRSQFYSLSGDRPPSAGGGFPAGWCPGRVLS